MVLKNPPMGWNSWDCYGPTVTEEQVRANADYMAKNLKEFGYEYVVVDIEWYSPTADSYWYKAFEDLCMDEYGRLVPAENRFPSAANGAGFKPLADYVHSLGLKFGIHIMRGMPRMAAHNRLPVKGTNFTCDQVAQASSVCKWNPDMYGLTYMFGDFFLCNEEGAKAYYESIFELYAEWGVDFVKVDDIAREYPHCEHEIELISNACRSCGRDIVLSLSPGPAPLEQAEHLKKYANMWRITDDFWDDWKLLLAMFERAEKWCVHTGTGHFPDADMLPVGALKQCEDPDGWTNFTEAEQRTMMSLWCMMRSPLMIGAEMNKNDDFTLALLTNKEILEIAKTTHGAHQLYRDENQISWITTRKDGKGGCLALFNISDEKRVCSLNLADLDVVCNDLAALTELWTKEKATVADGIVSIELGPHDAAVFGDVPFGL